MCLRYQSIGTGAYYYQIWTQDQHGFRGPSAQPLAISGDGLVYGSCLQPSLAGIVLNYWSYADCKVGTGRPNDPPPSYGSLQGEGALLLPQHQDGSDNHDRSKATGRRKLAKFVIAAAVVGFASIVLVIQIFQPCRHMLQRQHWVDEIAAHDDLMKDHREHWAQEEADHERRRVIHSQELQKWIAEKAEMDQWKADLERKRGDIIWGDYRDLGCSKYSKRHHSATLTNVPAGLDPRKECELKPMYIYDRWTPPSWCEDPQLCGKTVGHWEVNSSLCKPYISRYEDHGCIRRGTRQYKATIHRKKRGHHYYRSTRTDMTARKQLSNGYMKNARKLVIAILLGCLCVSILAFRPCAHVLQRRRWDEEVSAHKRLIRDEAAELERGRASHALQQQRWKDEHEAHNRTMKDHRQHWEQEEADHERWRVDHLQEQRKWIAEKAEMDQWKADLKRKRRNIIWGDYRDLGCSKYSKRLHSATLANVPAGLDPKKECELKPMYIDNQWTLPSWCEDPQLCGKMIGHWEVDSGLCKPFIGKYEDHGCIRRGTRQYKGKLENIQDSDNWHKLCMTMSGFYDGIDLGHPYLCSACNSGRCGYWAEWNIEDRTCER
ncbi:hypothetical protein D9619_009557 [Psilocybe cf. subviscida]|uniref:Uncharacterized protein n=1 Tax=Psilocybe cf. subviscida TaxID=2480587 RepID=A0A8H5F6F7_9AGAR|nr:hypothetical protein D9619_009557 [Psilocybe cf. subviscida]